MPESNLLTGRGSLPEQIARQLQTEILTDRSPGERLPTVIELARRFRVSKHSISNALEILARSNLITKRPGRGVCVARQKPSWRIGILSELDLLDPRIGHHFRLVATALKSQLEGQGAEPHLYVGNAVGGPGASDQPTCPRFWADGAAGRLDGAVILDVPSTPAWQARVRGCPIPAVGAMTGFEVRIDTAGVVATAVRRLAERGCQRLGLLSWHSVEPFRRAVSECGLTTRDTWIRSEMDPAVRGTGWEEFREIWTANGDRPNGLIILDDMLFQDAQWAILELDVRVPEELQLAVLTSKGAAPSIRLPLACAIELDPAETAAHLADMLLGRLRGELTAPVTRPLAFREIATEPPRSAGVRPQETHGAAAGREAETPATN